MLTGDIVNHCVQHSYPHLSCCQARFIPVSGQHGQNVKNPSREDIPWHTGSTLLEAMASVTPLVRPVEGMGPFRLPVQVRRFSQEMGW